MSTDDYNPQIVERKWQSYWDAHGTNTMSRERLAVAEDPYYNLMMFPYPSAKGLHIGNIYAFTGADVNGRYWRLKGKDVFEPIGFDAFGIHSENFAIKTQTNPNELIPRNIANFARQLRRIGGMFDWDHTVDTTDPNYYKWTQWVFIQLFNAGLAERREAPVNWCPSCMTVLANEQVIQGLCERCESRVEQRRLQQWFFRITNYAERLLENIESLDWSETTKKTQVNWIGRSDGAEITFKVVGSGDRITVFTTRPDTLFGATYVVLAPEHKLVARVTTESNKESVSGYLDSAAKKDLVERQREDREKTGVFTGAFCINPINGQEIPIWVADYILIEYGTGAIMAVPGHDQRDFEFASEFNLPIRRVIAGEGEEANTPLQAAFVGQGVLVNSGDFDGMSVGEAGRAIVDRLASGAAAKATTNFRLHDWCISRQRYWGPPIPVIHCGSCGIVVVPESDLPVLLPYVEDYQPDGSGIGPLARNEEWCVVNCPECGRIAKRETDVSDTFLDSGWYFLRYPSSDDEDAAMDPLIASKWLPVDSYIGGNEHAVLHLLYSRFITMVLKDIGVLDFEEPFQKFRTHGLLTHHGRKMSKSRGNVIVPDDLIDRYGADTLRMYLMFLGPFEQGGEYRGKGIEGPYGFLNKLWRSVTDAEDTEPDVKVEQALHRTIKKVTVDISNLRFNTAIAAMMEYLNIVRAGGRHPRREEVEPLVIMVSPFAPHIAEELYERLGHTESLFVKSRWPDFDEAKIAETEMEIPVQVNGKRRGAIIVPIDADEAVVLDEAHKHSNIGRYLEGVTIYKSIYVPGRMLNFVVGN